jgi:DNA-binding transcriptional MerR regulator
MNIGDVTDWVGLARTTIRKYLTDFGDIEGAFSQSAVPEAGKHRRFTNRDVAVIWWISLQYKEHRMATEDIRATLMEMVEDDEAFEEPPRSDEELSLALVPREQYEEVLAAHKQALDLAVAERDAISGMLDREREFHKQERAEWQAEIAKLNLRIGRLMEKVIQLGGDAHFD